MEGPEGGALPGHGDLGPRGLTSSTREKDPVGSWAGAVSVGHPTSPSLQEHIPGEMGTCLIADSHMDSQEAGVWWNPGVRSQISRVYGHSTVSLGGGLCTREAHPSMVPGSSPSCHSKPTPSMSC